MEEKEMKEKKRDEEEKQVFQTNEGGERLQKKVFFNFISFFPFFSGIFKKLF